MIGTTDEAVSPMLQRPVTVKAFGITDNGKVRANNEDQFLIAELTKSMRVSQTSLTEPKLQVGESAHISFSWPTAWADTAPGGGPSPGVNVEAHAFEVQAADRLLLCSDGLTEMVTNEAIAATLGAEPVPRLPRRSSSLRQMMPGAATTSRWLSFGSIRATPRQALNDGKRVHLRATHYDSQRRVGGRAITDALGGRACHVLNTSIQSMGVAY